MLSKCQLKDLVLKGYDAIGEGAFSLALITKFKGIGYNYDATYYQHELSRVDYINSLIDSKYAESDSAKDREFADVIVNLLNYYVDSAN